MYWVFHQGQLDQALAAYVARRQREGASEPQAKDEAALIQAFLIAGEAKSARLIGGSE